MILVIADLALVAIGVSIAVAGARIFRAEREDER